MSGNGKQRLALGLDAGSVAVKAVVVDEAGRLVAQVYRRMQGRPVEVMAEVLEAIVREYGDWFQVIAGTGLSGRLICQLLGVPFVNEVICQAAGVRHLHPEVRTIIEMGGQDSKLILLPEGGGETAQVLDFAMNTNCAAGTGSFLDQQASRLGIAIEEEFGRLALCSRNPPRVAGRCSVFAKSDMIHLQQRGTPVHDIVAGLCLGLARNLKSNLGRGRELPRPIAFCGGVAANAGVVHAVRTAFELSDGELIVPACHACTAALGAALIARRRTAGDASPLVRLNPAALRARFNEPAVGGGLLPPLLAPGNGRDGTMPGLPGRGELEARAAAGPIDAWLGLDVGSISTKVAVIDADGQVIAKVYLMTAGRPIEAVGQALDAIARQVGGLVRIRGAATTGSGRYLTGDLIGADLVINEITAQATAAAAIDPEVDTIFEIGGQDSKYISLDHGVVVDFEMNHACAAGTGSFLEEQAERLGISIKQQFGELAMASRAPVRLGERCTVFMESDLLSHQQRGAAREDLVAGLAYSIVSNYINRVVGHRRIGQRIFFQGGTAFNRAVVAAFERVSGRSITVPPHHEVTGAIGAALLARRHQEQAGRTTSEFRGFDAVRRGYDVRTFECDGCSNNCEISEVSFPGRPTLYYGSRCDRYNVKKQTPTQSRLPNLFAERQRLLLEHANITARRRDGRPTVGIPLALSNYQLLPFWGTLLSELDVNVVVSPASTAAIIRRGIEAVVSTPCFPVKVAHGHVLELIERGVDYVWLPSVVSMPREEGGGDFNQLCPYVTSIPNQIVAAIEKPGQTVKVLKPAVRFQEGPRSIRKSLAGVCGSLEVSVARLRRAVDRAWQAQLDFEEACRRRGREVLAALEPDQRAVVIVSRPYNGCDSSVSLDVGGKLRRLGVLPIPMDFLDLRPTGETDDRVLAQMYWKYGQRILRAAQIIRDDPRLSAVYLSNFGCGPDSFLISYFKRIMAPKPSLVVEIDEHSADAGVVTRLEAFLESLRHAAQRPVGRRVPLYPLANGNGQARTLYIPWMGDQAYALAAAFRGCGQPAQVIPIADETSIEIGRRHCSGKECLPCIITAGDMVRLTQRADFDPASSAFFMPGGSGPCRFGQYNAMHKLILADLGLGDVPIISPAHDRDFYRQMKRIDPNVTRLAWTGICAVDVLSRALLAVRPYENEPGTADRVYQAALEEVCAMLERRADDYRIAEALELAAARLAALRGGPPRPRIGIVGEIYVRHHRFANNDLVRQLEGLGAEVVMPGIAEWIHYNNWTRMAQAASHRDLRSWIGNYVQDRIQRKVYRHMEAAMAAVLAGHHEPTTEDLLELAEPYLDRSFEGEAILSIGKMVELCRQGVQGIINVMPFSCMPSTIVSAVARQVQSRLDGLPILSISYDGQQDPTLLTRLEAFVYQAQVRGGYAPIS